jgi:N-acyl-D-aspartate/D-glutamate deacylase
MGLERAIAKATSLPAARIGLADRGRLVPGAAADVVVLDLDALADRATYADPMRPPRGVRDVLVAGTPVLRHGEPTAARPGRLLRAAA